jgi:hypothetical protein
MDHDPQASVPALLNQNPYGPIGSHTIRKECTNCRRFSIELMLLKTLGWMSAAIAQTFVYLQHIGRSSIDGVRNNIVTCRQYWADGRPRDRTKVLISKTLGALWWAVKVKFMVGIYSLPTHKAWILIRTWSVHGCSSLELQQARCSLKIKKNLPLTLPSLIILPNKTSDGSYLIPMVRIYIGEQTRNIPTLPKRSFSGFSNKL